jgi:hypothetical protein
VRRFDDDCRSKIAADNHAIHFEDGAEDGAEVKKGQPLFTIDPRLYEAAVISAKGTLAKAEAAQQPCIGCYSPPQKNIGW